MSLKELIKREVTPTEGYNEMVRRRLAFDFDSIGIVSPGSMLTSHLKKNNAGVLTRGSYGGAVVDKPGTDVRAISGGANLERTVTIGADCAFHGVGFGPGVGAASLVDVSTGASAVFIGCTFEASADKTSSFVSIASGAKAVFLGCVFRGGGATPSPVIAHAGTDPLNVQVAYCYNATGNALFVPAVAQVWVLTITNTGAAGDVHGVTLNGVLVGTRTTLAGDTVTDVRDGLFTQLQRNTYPPIGTADARIQMKTSGAAAIEFTAIDAGTGFTIGSTSTGTAASSVVNTTPNTVAGATGTGNI